MPKLPGAGSNEKMSVEKTEFSTPSDDTENSKLRLPTSTSHRTFLGVQAAGKILQNLTDTVITRNKARFQIRLGTYASLLSNAFFPSISKARSVVASILSRGKGKDEPDEGEGKLIVKDSRSGKSYNIPIRKGSIGAMEFQQMITTSKFSAFLGRPVEGSLKVLDVGFQNTACAESSITYVDGENGMILFRGHNIDDLYRYRCFDEVAYLLIWGELPHAWQLAQFRAEFAKLANPPQSVIDVINIFPRDTPAFLMLIAGLAAWAAAVPEMVPVHVGETLYMNNPRMVDASVKQCFASFSAVVALVYCHQRSHAFTPAEEHRTVPENILRMMHFVDKSTKKPSSAMVEELDKLLILYADHEMTASTAAFLHTGSVGADALTSCTSCIATGFGPLHAGAIDLVFKKLEEIGSVANVEAFIEKVRKKEQRLMGAGHRLYKTQDPRGKLLRERLLELSLTVEMSPLLAVALEIERVVNEDEYFTSRKLCINADLYGSLVFSALGFEKDIITCLAALGRCAGALAHWREAANKPPKIWRPTQVYTGPMKPGQGEGA